MTNFSAAQLTLIAAVAAAAKGPVVALVFSGGAMDISPLLANPKVCVGGGGRPPTPAPAAAPTPPPSALQIAAVLICGQPSINVIAVGDVIFG